MAKIISLTGHMVVRPEKEKEFTVLIKTLVSRIRKHQGCLNYRFYQEIENESTYCFLGTWKTPAEAKASFQTDEFSLLLTAFELLKKPPEIRYNLVLFRNGLEAIQRLRNHQAIENKY